MERGLWNSILRQYGQAVKLRRGEAEVQTRAFFQPVAEKTAGQVPTALGVAPAGKWLYLGPAEEALDDVEELRWDDRSFHILRHRGYPVGESIAYQWAVCQEMDEVRA